MSGAELAYRYLAPSSVRPGGDRSDMLLITSGGVTESGSAACPYFFSGLLTDPAVAAAGMLACAAVARAQYLVPGFGEVQALARSMRLADEVTGMEALRFVRSLPRSARWPLWARRQGARFRWAGRVARRVCIAGPHRLAELVPLMRFARRLRVYGPDIASGAQERRARGSSTSRRTPESEASEVPMPRPAMPQEAASHADRRTTMRYDRARVSLDRHATYIVAAYIAGAAR